MSSKITLVLRLLLGLALVVFGANKFANFMPPMELPDAAGSFMGALVATGYMMTLVAIVEILAGLLLLINKAVPFALVILAPISVNIILFHALLDPANIGPAALVFVLNAYLMLKYWDSYKSLF
ncbi:DoxX family membrane protein [Leptobacterium sp. I13]|uniref:DoxX family membrane protein n=1 Tax=Leptobacterium meishanense TaxID=3128904 RepID=UPI0030EC6C57